MTTVNNTDYLLHKLRNCYSRDEDERRADRLEAADLIEKLGKEVQWHQELLADAVEWAEKEHRSRVDPKWLTDARYYLGID